MEKFLRLVSGMFKFHTSPELARAGPETKIVPEQHATVQETNKDRPSSENLQRRMMSFGIKANDAGKMSEAQVETSIDRMIKIRKEKAELTRQLDVLNESMRRRAADIEEITQKLRLLHEDLNNTKKHNTEMQKTAIANSARIMMKRRDILQTSLFDLQNKIGAIEMEISNMEVTEDNSASVRAMHHLNETRSLMMNQPDVPGPMDVSIARSEIESREKETRSQVDTLFSIANSDMTQNNFTPPDVQTETIMASLGAEFSQPVIAHPMQQEHKIVFANKRIEQFGNTQVESHRERELNTN
jgi:hypothetical protein